MCSNLYGKGECNHFTNIIRCKKAPDDVHQGRIVAIVWAKKAGIATVSFLPIRRAVFLRSCLAAHLQTRFGSPFRKMPGGWEDTASGM
jgi:hypothetical protein